MKSYARITEDNFNMLERLRKLIEPRPSKKEFLNYILSSFIKKEKR